jgi:hypothetical protein
MPPGIGYGDSTNDPIFDALGEAVQRPVLQEMSTAKIDVPQGTRPQLEQAGFVRPAGDPFHYKVAEDGKTVLAYSDKTGFVETDVQTARANLSEKALTSLGITPQQENAANKRANARERAQQQANAAQEKQRKQQPSSVGGQFLRGLGVGARNLLEGAAGTVGLLTDPINTLNPLSDTFMNAEAARGSTRRGMDALLDMANLPEAQTDLEKLAARLNRLGGGAMIGGVAGKALKAARAAQGGRALSASRASRTAPTGGMNVKAAHKGGGWYDVVLRRPNGDTVTKTVKGKEAARKLGAAVQ